mmetsp:Transcript_23117/g.48150  ORF Transcript_23117/g.48150 Transcript_23117/m.48150 type:complete len:262 (+) Transcript_23117:56-841(+)
MSAYRTHDDDGSCSDAISSLPQLKQGEYDAVVPYDGHGLGIQLTVTPTGTASFANYLPLYDDNQGLSEDENKGAAERLRSFRNKGDVFLYINGKNMTDISYDDILNMMSDIEVASRNKGTGSGFCHFRMQHMGTFEGKAQQIQDEIEVGFRHEEQVGAHGKSHSSNGTRPKNHSRKNDGTKTVASTRMGTAWGRIVKISYWSRVERGNCRSHPKFCANRGSRCVGKAEATGGIRGDPTGFQGTQQSGANSSHVEQSCWSPK